MKKVIRRSCFETNSSSMHSILITKNDIHVTQEELRGDDYKYNDDCYEYIYLWGKDEDEWNLCDADKGYGRHPFELLTTFEEKFKYALCEFCSYYYGDEEEFQKMYSNFEALAHDIIPDMEKLKTPTRDLDIYLDKDGNEIQHKNLHYDYWNKEKDAPEYYYIDENGEKQKAILDEENYLEVPAIGMIDHQSHGLLRSFLAAKGITLKEFLTNKKYVVVIDSDEYCDFDRYLKSGLIDRNFITEIYGNSGEAIEYQEWLLKEQKENEESSS